MSGAFVSMNRISTSTSWEFWRATIRTRAIRTPISQARQLVPCFS